MSDLFHRYAECRYAECRYAECRGTLITNLLILLYLIGHDVMLWLLRLLIFLENLFFVKF